MEQKTYDPMVSGVNPFVRNAIKIILEHDEGSFALPELAALLAEREPMLSPFNCECAAKEALRREADYREAMKKAALLAAREALRREAEERAIAGLGA